MEQRNKVNYIIGKPQKPMSMLPKTLPTKLKQVIIDKLFFLSLAKCAPTNFMIYGSKKIKNMKFQMKLRYQVLITKFFKTQFGLKG